MLCGGSARNRRRNPMLGEATGLRKVYPTEFGGWRSARGESRLGGGGGGERLPGQLIQNEHSFL